MKPEFRKLRVKQLERMLQPLITARGVSRPQKGWIRAIREVTGITLREVAQRLGGRQQGSPISKNQRQTTNLASILFT